MSNQKTTKTKGVFLSCGYLEQGKLFWAGKVYLGRHTLKQAPNASGIAALSRYLTHKLNSLNIAQHSLTQIFIYEWQPLNLWMQWHPILQIYEWYHLIYQWQRKISIENFTKAGTKINLL